MKHWIEINGAYNFMTPGKTNYGRHNMEIYHYVKGRKGVLWLRLFTAWTLPEFQQSYLDMMTKGYPFDPIEELCQPKAAGIDCVGRKPFNEYSSVSTTRFWRGPAYYTGSATYAMEFIPGFLHGGSDWLFPKLEEVYESWFNGGPKPDLTPVPQTHPDDREKLNG